jgi:trehalose/maltose hydrolase-like predicted phosphorylase
MITPRTMGEVFAPGDDTAWYLNEQGDDPLRESNRESRFAISNGFLGVRGARSINRLPRAGVPPHTYVAGLFDTLESEGATPGLIPLADWLALRILVNGDLLARDPACASRKPLTLQMRRGVMLADWDASVDGASTGMRLRALRLVSMSQRALGLELIHLELGNQTADIVLEARVEPANLGLVNERLEQDMGVWRTEHTGRSVALAAAVTLSLGGRDVTPAETGPLRWCWRWTSRVGEVASLSRLVAITRSDAKAGDPGPMAQAALEGARRLGWSGVLADHEHAWAARWGSSGVDVQGDPAAQRALRFALYHLNGAANPADDHVSIGARALTGDDYRGHVFWDTEIFLLPFYTLTWPAAARALLMYRFHTLAGARAKAARMGWRGALYAWESTDTGDEMTPEHVIGPDRKVVEVLCGRQEQHISADIAYAVWRYWLATRDEGFLIAAGAEILLETGRFWASRAVAEADGHAHIRRVIGPDEYHETIDDNAFTNVMARWNIRRALEVAALLAERWPREWARLETCLCVSASEMDQWRNIADTIADGFDPKTGLFEQFAGYFALEDIDLAPYAGRSVPLDVVLGRERTRRTQVVKQADVVALLALLPQEFPPGAAAANFGYYEPRCGHGSSLSPAMHGLVAARLGETEMALRYFHQTGAIDLSDTHVAVTGGVHIAALGGLWQIAVLGFAGLSLLPDGIALAPRLPASWTSLRFVCQWRGRSLDIRIDHVGQCVDVSMTNGLAMTVTLGGAVHALDRDHPIRIGDSREAGTTA